MTEFLAESALAATTARLAREIDADHPDGVVLIGVLRGALFVLADVARQLTVPTLVDFLAITPYEPGSGRVRLLKDIDIDISGHDVVLVEDVVDTGLTLSYVLQAVRARQPRNLRVCSLLDRRSSRIVPVTIDYTGHEISSAFALGYGLDYCGRYRNLRSISLADPDALAADPDAHIADLYP